MEKLRFYGVDSQRKEIILCSDKNVLFNLANLKERVILVESVTRNIIMREVSIECIEPLLVNLCLPQTYKSNFLEFIQGPTITTTNTTSNTKLLLKFDDLNFSDNGSIWSQVCKTCALKLGLSNSQMDDYGSGICGVKGCNKEQDTLYFDFL